MRALLSETPDAPVLRLLQATNLQTLLAFLGPADPPLAIEMAERAHREDTAIAASYRTIGQMHARLSDVDAGIEAYDIALSMTERGSQYDPFLLVLKEQAQLAAKLPGGLARTLETSNVRKPELAFFMEPFCSPVGKPSRVARWPFQIPRRNWRPPFCALSIIPASSASCGLITA